MRIQIYSFTIFASAFSFSSFSSAQETSVLLAAPHQDQGLPYTRSARKEALAKISDCIAVFPGSRYAYVKGYKVRLDDKDWKAEAVMRDGIIHVPASFAALLSLADVKPIPAPDYLAEKWVYEFPRAESQGRDLIPLIAAAQKLGLKSYQNSRGLLFIGANPPTLEGVAETQVEAIVTLFDTPEKFADPDIATKHVPTLRRQGKWTDHVKVTPEQLALVNGPETQWPTVPKSQYDYKGFNSKLLGSEVPAPGVYPRVLFSPEDLPMLAANMKRSKTGQMSLIQMEHLFTKSWWDPTTSDGGIFQKLHTGDLSGLEWDVTPETSPSAYPGTFKGQKPGISNSHVSYNSECLTAMALYCLLTGNGEQGRKCAAAIANYFKLREPLIDEINTISDSEYGSSYTRPDGAIVPMNGSAGTTHARGTAGALNPMNLGMCLDFAGKWMNADEKDLMRRVIAKSTYGRRAYGQDGPIRFRDVNWVGWDTPYFWGVVAIEGLEGFDREVYESNFETVRAFCDWGIDNAGVVYESNGKTPASFQSLMISMVAMARRGENLWGHPHWRKLLEGQIQMTSPTGKVVVNSGTQYFPFSAQLFSFQFLTEIKSFYPDDLKADYLLSQSKHFPDADPFMRSWKIDSFDAEAYRASVGTLKSLRLPSLTYPGFVNGVLYDADYKSTERVELELPLDFNSPVHGVYSSYSDRTPDAAWINMMVRPNHYLGAGHHHADAGMFHFSALGVDWITESPFSQTYDGKYHNQVLVDGISEPAASSAINTGYQAAATYLGASDGFASADLTNSYSYCWETQAPQIWGERDKAGWEMDPSPHIAKMFAGTARYKMRPWWANYNYVNYMATSRAPFNPMRYVYRSVGLIRGPHPYGLVIDDVKKDDNSRLYEWTAMLNGGVWKAEISELSPNQVVLAFRDPKTKDPAPIIPAVGAPLLLVCDLGGGSPLVETAAGPNDRKGAAQTYDRLVIPRQATEAKFRVALIPFRAGDPLPIVTEDSIKRVNQTDGFNFSIGNDRRTKLIVDRGGEVVAEIK